MKTEYSHFKKLLEYFVTHLEWLVTNNVNNRGYGEYIKPLIETNTFKRTGQGYAGDQIQQQIKKWEHYENGKICINIQPNFGSYKSSKSYLNWWSTGLNIVANWSGDKITSLYQEEYLEDNSGRIAFGNENSIEDLGLFNEQSPDTEALINFYHSFNNAIIAYNKLENKKKMKLSIKPIKDLLEYKKQIILQGPPGTGKTRKAKEIAKEFIGVDTIDDLEGHEQFKLVQFHPSYTYEDFVEGLKPVMKSEKLTYEVKPEILKLVIKDAMKAFLSDEMREQEDNSFDQLFIEFAQSLKTKEDKEPTIFTTKSNIEIYFHSYTDSHINVIYRWANRDEINEGIHVFKLSKFKFQQLLEKEIDPLKVKNLRNEIKPTVKFHQSEYFAVYKELYNFITSKKVDVDTISTADEDYNSIFEAFQQIPDPTKIDGVKKYTLVIDEINRANLSSVLGELIYALEYRGKEVQSIYGEEGEAPLILPPNLYIIGTMNTADRSVGHIDYAIRRRFAFVDILPKELQDDSKMVFHKEWFRKVSSLFIENYDEYAANEKVVLKPAATLSSEFRPEDVWLGHSYFIRKKETDENGNDVFTPDDFSIRLEYEIKPILLEYVKDGILIGNVSGQKIEDYIKSQL